MKTDDGGEEDEVRAKCRADYRGRKTRVSSDGGYRGARGSCQAAPRAGSARASPSQDWSDSVYIAKECHVENKSNHARSILNDAAGRVRGGTDRRAISRRPRAPP